MAIIAITPQDVRDARQAFAELQYEYGIHDEDASNLLAFFTWLEPTIETHVRVQQLFVQLQLEMFEAVNNTEGMA